MEKGKFYLFASPWFWTQVGRYVRHVNFQQIEIADAIYFTKPGATFDLLCLHGLNANSEAHGPIPQRFVPAVGVIDPWRGPTPWVGKTPGKWKWNDKWLGSTN